MFDIDLPLGSARGRRRQAPAPCYVRDLSAEDLPSLLAPAPVGAEPHRLTRLRDRHHSVARLMAEGRRDIEIAAMLGMSQSWLSTLKQDPAFRELVEFYRAQKEAIFQDAQQRLATLGGTAVAILQDKLDEDGESLSVRELKEIAEFAFDRSVAPAKSAGSGPAAGNGFQINVNFVNSGGEVPAPSSDFDAVRGAAIDAEEVR